MLKGREIFMKINKRITLGIAMVVSIIIAIVIIINGVIDMNPRRGLNNFVRQIEQGNIYDITLTIYYSNILTPAPITLRDLINIHEPLKIVVDGTKLSEYVDLLKTIGNADLTRIRRIPRINARIHYVFEDARGRKIFDVTMWGFGRGDDLSGVFINGIEFRDDDIFIDIIEPFLPIWQSSN